MVSNGPDRSLPGELFVAGALVLVEALALAGFAALDLADVHADRLALGIGTSVFFLVYAGGQVIAVVALLRRAGWARGLIVFTQLVQLGLAWGLRSADPRWLAVALAAVALAVLVCLLRPASTRALYGSEHDTRDA